MIVIGCERTYLLMEQEVILIELMLCEKNQENFSHQLELQPNEVKLLQFLALVDSVVCNIAKLKA